jgi:hypothetical protein
LQQSIRIYYQSLTELHSNEEKSLFDYYIVLKSQTAFTAKPGFLTTAEIGTLANKFYHGKRSTVDYILKKLTRFGYILRTPQGYRLTSYKHVINNLTTFKPTTNAKGVVYHPYAKATVHGGHLDKRTLSLLRTYFLLIQSGKRTSHTKGLKLKTKTRTKNSANKNIPARIEIALTYLKKAGKYSSKTVVYNQLKQLETVGLITINKGKFNHAIESYDTNVYTVYPLEYAHWNRLRSQKCLTDALPVAPKRKRVSTPRVKVKRTILEQRFIDFVSVSMDKKIGKNSISKTLNSILSNEDLKKRFLSEFNTDNVMVQLKNKTLFDNRARGHHRTNYSYTVEIASLVETGGNYIGQTLTSYDAALLNCIQKRNQYLIDANINSLIDDISGEISIEDIDDYYKVMGDLKVKHFGYDTLRMSSVII